MANGDGKNTAGAVILGGLSGAALALLFSARPVSAAPDSTKLDYIATLLEQSLAGDVNALKVLNDILVALGGEPGIPPVAEEPELIFQLGIRQVAQLLVPRMVAAKKGEPVYFRIESSLDQVIGVQLISNMTPVPATAIPVGAVVPCAVGGIIEITQGDGNTWRPYFGFLLIPAGIPTLGLFNIWALGHEQ